MKLKEFHSLDKKEYIEVFKDLVGYQEDDIYQHCLNIVDKYDDYWYKTGDLDFYNEKDYIFDAFICFLDYSRGVLRYVFNHFNEVNYKPKSILDYIGHWLDLRFPDGIYKDSVEASSTTNVSVEESTEST